MKTLILILFYVSLTSCLFCQVNVLVIDYGNSFTSDQTSNNSIIYNRLLSTQNTVTRVSSIPSVISSTTYDQVWLFGNPGLPTSGKLGPFVNFMNNGGSVYIQSEVYCCPNQAAFVDQLIDLTVTAGASIDHSIVTAGKYQAILHTPPCSNSPQNWTTHGVSARLFQGINPVNILLSATGSCNGPFNTGDVVGAVFRSCDMISGQGALISTGDFHIFPSNGTCANTSNAGTPNHSILIDYIATSLESAKNCSSNPTTSISMNSTIDTTICAGFQWPGTIFTSNPVGATFDWTNSNTAIGLGANGVGNMGPFVTTNNTGAPITGQIIVMPTLNGCPGAPDTFNITVSPSPIVDAGLDTTVCVGDAVGIGGNPTASGGAGGPYSYNWTPATTLNNANTANPTITLTQSGVFSFQVTVTDGVGCSSEDDVLVSNLPVEQCLDTILPSKDTTKEYSLFIPNAFTPDNDGLNEGFKPLGTGISELNYSFKIFNRWGETIFESTSLNHAWFGDFKGTMLTSGIYVWRLECRAINGMFIKKTGHVTLIN